MPMKIGFILANSADPDEMLPHAAFHLELHYLKKYLFTGTQNERVKRDPVLHHCVTRTRCKVKPV